MLQSVKLKVIFFHFNIYWGWFKIMNPKLQYFLDVTSAFSVVFYTWARTD